MEDLGSVAKAKLRLDNLAKKARENSEKEREMLRNNMAYRGEKWRTNSLGNAEVPLHIL